MRTNFRSDVTSNKRKESREEKAIEAENKRIDTSLSKIKKLVMMNRGIDASKLVKIVIHRGLVTKDKLTTQQLYNSTKEIIEDILLDLGEIDV